MQILSRLPHLAHHKALVPIVLTTLVLGACGGGSDDTDPPDGGPGAPVPTPSITALEGDWVQKGCVKVGGQSFKKTLRARITSQNTLDYYEGVLTFGGNECAGASQLAGPTKLGGVTFARSEANQALAAHWGELRTVTGTRFGAIWTLRPANLLCLLGDGIPSSQPSLSAVAESAASVPADNCFTR